MFADREPHLLRDGRADLRVGLRPGANVRYHGAERAHERAARTDRRHIAGPTSDRQRPEPTELGEPPVSVDGGGQRGEATAGQAGDRRPGPRERHVRATAAGVGATERGSDRVDRARRGNGGVGHRNRRSVLVRRAAAPRPSTSSSSSSASSSTSSSSSSTSGFVVLTDVASLDVKVGFTETDAPKVHVGQAATITLDALTGKTFTGKILSLDTNQTVVSNVVTYYAKVGFDAASPSIKPGMTASVAVVLDKRDDVVTLPTSAVPTSGTSATVTVRGSDGKDVEPVDHHRLARRQRRGNHRGAERRRQGGRNLERGQRNLERIPRRRQWPARWRRPRRRDRRMSDTPVIALREITKIYGEGATTVNALRGVSIDIAHGEYLAIMGASGSGKSTLMHIIGCLDQPTDGQYFLDGVAVATLDSYALGVVRNRKIGFVFQSFNLIPRTTALANVELPLVYAGVKKVERRERATLALESVGLGDRLDHTPNQLSGGQQQRVAIARAIVTNPSIILADEPTGALDSESTAEVLDRFDSLHREGRTVIVITHEHDVAERAARVIRLRDGSVLDDVRQSASVSSQSVGAPS